MLMADKMPKYNRILDLYQRLCNGEVLRKDEESVRFGVDQRSIQRDIDDIRAFLADMIQRGDSRKVVFDRSRGGFVLKEAVSLSMTNGEALAVSKILLESRAFPREEMETILDKLVSGCVPTENRKLVNKLISNERYHYMELTKPASVQEKLWGIGVSIREQRLLELTYQRQDTSQPPVRRDVEPVALIFSEFYFYLNAHIVEANERGGYTHKYNFPAIFRLDRILDYKTLKENFRVNYADRFQEGEFRKRVQFMYPGQLLQVRFRYTGVNVDAVLDRLPTAYILSHDETRYEIQTEVYGDGIIMWLMGQGNRVEVLAPPELREQMRDSLQKALRSYQN